MGRRSSSRCAVTSKFRRSFISAARFHPDRRFSTNRCADSMPRGFRSSSSTDHRAELRSVHRERECLFKSDSIFFGFVRSFFPAKPSTATWLRSERWRGLAAPRLRAEVPDVCVRAVKFFLLLIDALVFFGRRHRIFARIDVPPRHGAMICRFGARALYASSKPPLVGPLPGQPVRSPSRQVAAPFRLAVAKNRPRHRCAQQISMGGVFRIRAGSHRRPYEIAMKAPPRKSSTIVEAPVATLFSARLAKSPAGRAPIMRAFAA